MGTQQFTTPDVYAVNSGTAISERAKETQLLCTMIGETALGTKSEVERVTSFNEYTDKFCILGRVFEKPLDYQVYQFYTNVGKGFPLDIIKVSGAPNYALSTANVGDGSTTNLVFQSLVPGEEGNKLSITSASVTSEPNTFNLTIGLNGDTVETHKVSTQALDTNYFVSYLNDNSKYVRVKENGNLLAGTYTFSGGVNETPATLADYKEAIERLDEDEHTYFASIDAQDKDILSAFNERCQLKGIIPILSTGEETTEKDKEKCTELKTFMGDSALSSPYVIIVDPEDSSSTLTIPNYGTILGLYANWYSKHKIHESPGGTDAVLKGVVGLSRRMTKDKDVSVLNVENVNCIVNDKQYGVLLWGVRNLQGDKDKRFKYLSDLVLNRYIHFELQKELTSLVFKPGEDIMSLVNINATGFMSTLFEQGALKGSSESEAYKVVCDDSNNDNSTSEQGVVIVDIYYAAKKPGEFILIRLNVQNETIG